MKLRGSILSILIIGGAILWTSNKPFFSSKEKESAIMFAVTNFMDQMHFDPKDINDELSEEIYDSYIKNMDPGKRFLTTQDIEQLRPYKTEIDDQINNKQFEFFDLSVQLLDQGIDKAQSYYKEILSKPFDFTSSEKYEVENDKKVFASNDKELKSNWEKTLKYETLVRLKDKLDAQEEEPEEGEEAVEKKSFETLEKESREKVLEIFDEWFKNMKKLERSDRFETFVNSLTHTFDPHTDYFNPKEKEDFDMKMAGHFEGIGARLQTDGEFTKVVQIIPGGPAWKGKQLEEDDVITDVAQEGEDPISVVGMRIDKVVTFIRGKKGTKVSLYVKKIDGSKKVIIIERDKVIVDEGRANSLVLNQGDEMGNIGYIRLPSFYADFGDKDGRSSATDVGNEIEKLKEQNINGIILDLRSNGGGSFKDVVDMSGFFIEKGPIVQAKSRGRDPYMLKDSDPEVKYDGPLIVMVNNYSASASEILAAALQDYNRAVIVGSKSTFGKGTVQRFFDLDRFIQGDDLKPLGEIKVTTQKFYRINGGSTQLKGVTPDINLPDNFQFIEVGEKDMDYPLKWTKIDAVDYAQDIYQVQNLEGLRSASEKRVASNEDFNKVLDNARRFKRLDEETEMPLNLDAFSALWEARDAEAKKYKKIGEAMENLEVTNTPSYLIEIAQDSSKMARNDVWKENITKDIYLEETLAIMKDMVLGN